MALPILGNSILLRSVGEDRQQLILIGNAPSSGSTLLADLIDSAPFAACGPELELFCNRELYSYKNYVRDTSLTSHIGTLRATGIHTRFDHFHAYGLTKEEWLKSLKSSDGLNSWLTSFAQNYLRFRNKPVEGFVFEKTPQNVNAIDLFLGSNPNRKFIYVVRHPLYVIDSLLRRGWGPYTAAATWLVNVALFWPFREDHRVSTIQYEDLVKSPFELVSKVLEDVCSGFSITPKALESAYEQNEYRTDSVKRIDAWSTGTEKQISNANAKNVSGEADLLFNAMLTTKISKEYAKAYHVPELSMKEALDFFDYEYHEKSSHVRLPTPQLGDYKKLTAKTVRYLIRGEGFKTSLAHFRAIERL